MRTCIIILLLAAQSAYGQNYQCLQPGIKRYFTNGNGYLRGMRIDSVRTSGMDVIYYPYHTPRGTYHPYTGGAPVLDANGGSWLGKQVIQQSDGTFLFDNLWHDTVVIKANAAVGDHWILYNDTALRYYRADVISADTITVLGTLDSVKTINITAYDDTGLVPADPYNNFKIHLGKNHGFVQVFDLYTFPYHFYGKDYFMDRVLTGTGFPTPANSSFMLTSLINPTYAQLYDWNVGDVFENSTGAPWTNSTGMYPFSYYVDTIINKTLLPDGVRFSFSGWAAKQVLPIGPPPVTDYNYSYAIGPDTGSFMLSNDLLIDTALMPEEYTQTHILYYWPYDTTRCIQSAMYRSMPAYFRHDTLNIPIEGSGPNIIYKGGIGLLNYFQGAPELAPSYITDTTLLFYVKGGSFCGAYTVPSPIFTAVNDPKTQHGVLISPNPAKDMLTIKSADQSSCTITIWNMPGRNVKTIHSKTGNEAVDVSTLLPGVYNVTIDWQEGEKCNKQLVVTH